MSLLEARGLRQTYRRGRLRRGAEVPALDGIDLMIEAASIVGLAGPSGCGKSTLARCLALLEKPQEGVIRLHGEPVSGLRGAALRAMRRRVQLLFQDPAAALNPRFNVAEALAEPLRLDPQRRWADKGVLRERCVELLAEVELEAKHLGRSVAALSGGQRQRVTLARALAVEPELLILDEGLSRLDRALRERMVELLRDLQGRRGLALLMISHDQSFLESLTPQVWTMEEGRFTHKASPEP